MLCSGLSEGRVPWGARIPAPVQTGAEAHKTFGLLDIVSVSRVQNRGVALTIEPHIKPNLKKE